MIFQWFMRLLTPRLPDDYYVGVILKLQERAQQLNIPDDVAVKMWTDAVANSNPTIVGLAPGALMNKAMDQWEVEHKISP